MNRARCDGFRIQVIRDAPGTAAADRLLHTLAHVLAFETTGAEGSAARGTIVLGSPAGSSAPDTVPSFSAPVDALGEQRCSEQEVRFADAPEVPFPFRNRRVRTLVPRSFRPLATTPSDTVLATTSSGVLWSVHRAHGVRHDRSALPLLAMGPQQALNDVLGGDRFIENLPLLHFLFAVGTPRWQTPPLRAAFIFDDPNLHWHSYGYVRYQDIAERAMRENFHAAFAFIPLDAWFTHRPTAAIFRQNRRWLSLLVHGNNHGKRELAQAASAGAEALLRQAVRRIEHLEARAGLDVCRVMVPPHGACSSHALAALPHAGFEAACISPGSLQAHSVNAAAAPALGFFPAEHVAGCHVLPRSGFGSCADNAMLVAAYLGRPMVLRGHHHDLKHGLELLDRHARFINGLGRVEWLDLASLARSSYRFADTAGVCTLEPRSRRVDFAVSPTATHLRIAAGADVTGEPTYAVRVEDHTVELTDGEPLALDGAAAPRIVSVTTRLGRQTADARRAASPRTAAALIARRLLTESRDRLAPVFGAGR